jgi:glucokinase
MTTLFVADIGGTKSDLAIVPLAESGGQSLFQNRYTNAEFTGIEEIIEHFMAEVDHVPEVACLAVAGVVDDSKAKLTNLPWEIDCGLLEKRFGFKRAHLINDLTALCSSLAMLEPADLLEIQPGCVQETAVCGVVAPGTGLGEGLLVNFGGQLFVRGTEGGHTDFAPVDEEQRALLSWMQKKQRPVNYEMLISGPGLANLYDFLKEYHQIPESAWIVEAMSKTKDRIPLIVAGAMNAITGMDDRPCPLCRQVVELFLSILGSEAGNLALKLYARGGIYLGGGILPRLVGQVKFEGFLRGFHAKGQMSGLMKDIPVYLILRKDAPLIGAARFARQLLKGRVFDGR